MNRRIGKFIKILPGLTVVVGVMLALILLAGCAPAAPADTIVSDTIVSEAPDSEAQTAGSGSVTISVECGFATAAGVAAAPESGVILAPTVAELEDGDTMWDVFSRVCREKRIVVAKNGSGKAVFVKAIGGLAPVSAESGWMFTVNGEFVMTSSGNIPMKDGDVVVWLYTMDSGDDLRQEL